MFKTKRQIQSIKAREILDSRGNPTVEAASDAPVLPPVLPPASMSGQSCATMTLPAIWARVDKRRSTKSITWQLLR